MVLGQGNNVYIFPGVAKALIEFNITKCNWTMFYIAARSLASCLI